MTRTIAVCILFSGRLFDPSFRSESGEGLVVDIHAQPILRRARCDHGFSDCTKHEPGSFPLTNSAFASS